MESSVPLQMELDSDMTGLNEMLRTATVIDADATGNGSSSYIPACGITRRRIEENQFDLRFLERMLRRVKVSSSTERQYRIVNEGEDSDGAEDERLAFNEMEAAQMARGPYSFSQAQSCAVESTVVPVTTSGHVFAGASLTPFAPQMSAFDIAVDKAFDIGTLTLEQAEEQICNGLQEARLLCQRWTDVYGQELFRAFAREKKHVVMQLCISLCYITQFLHMVNRSWGLTRWTELFFVSTVETSLPEVLRCLTRLAGYEGCEWMDAAGLVHAQEVHSKLIAIWQQKQAMEKYRESAADAELERKFWNALKE